MRLIIQAIDGFLDIFATEKGEGEIIMARPASLGSAHIIGAQRCVINYFFPSVVFIRKFEFIQRRPFSQLIFLASTSAQDIGPYSSF